MARRHDRSVSRIFGMAIVVAVTALWALPAGASGGLIRLSSDPYSNPDSQHRTEVEPDTYAFGSTEVGTFQVGRFFCGGATNIGWTTSTDGGTTWTHGFLPGITVAEGGPYDRASDPSVAYDAKHGVWMVSSLGILTGGGRCPVHSDLLLSRSTDGVHWDAPVPLHIGNSASFLDKNWTACDNAAASPFYGNCYTEFDNAANRDEIEMTTSGDGGLTWSNPIPTADHGDGLGGQPVVQPDGTVIVPILRFGTKTADMASFRSTDGGASWSATARISDFQTFSEPVPVRNPDLPSAEVDGSGRVYVAWYDCRFQPACARNDIVISTSDDGVAWTTPSRVPIDPVGSSADHFTPGIGVDPTTAGASAHVGVTYYSFADGNCSVATCLLNVGFISSVNGGSSWSAPNGLAGPMNLAWLPETTQGYMYGDYVSTSFAPSHLAYPVFAVARAPGHGERPRLVPMFTAAGGLRAAGGSVVGGTEILSGPGAGTALGHAAPSTAN